MYGLAEIRSINAHAAEKSKDEARRKKGLKPASAAGRAIRASSVQASPAQKRTGPRKVVLQGREVEV